MLVTAKLLCSYTASFFLDFSYSLESCIAVFAFEEAVTYSSLYRLVLGEKHLSDLVRIWRLFQMISMDSPVPHLLFLFVSEFLRLYTFCGSCKARSNDESLPFCFPWGSLECSSSCGLSQSCKVQLAFHLCSPMSAKVKCLCFRGAHRELAKG